MRCRSARGSYYGRMDISHLTHQAPRAFWYGLINYEQRTPRRLT